MQTTLHHVVFLYIVICLHVHIECYDEQIIYILYIDSNAFCIG